MIESGTHSGLLAAVGLYHRLWNLQSRILSDRNGS
jgi:ABC-type multidrug transport system fused ATPase/permease subunit